MPSNRKWQQTLLDDLSVGLRAEEAVKALVLTGSLADDALTTDEWSDIDLTAIIADDMVVGLFSCASWLERHGEIIGLERHDHPNAKILRVCFAPCRRVDITLVPESVLGKDIGDDGTVAPRAHALLWSKIPEIGPFLPGLFPCPTFDGVAAQDVDSIAERFYLKASVAIAKTVRNDLLVALDLALSLSRDCLVLQMLRRDRDQGTSVHRFGGFGNEIVTRLYPGIGGASRLEILRLIRRSTQILDELASDLLPGYTPRAQSLISALLKAEAACVAGATDERRGEQPAQRDR